MVFRRIAFAGLAAALCGPAFSAAEDAGVEPSERGRERASLPFRKADATPADSGAATVLAVLGLALGGGALVAFRAGKVRPSRLRQEKRAAIERLSTQVLAKGATLHAVRWHGEDLLVACTERQVTLLARREADPETQESP